MDPPFIGYLKDNRNILIKSNMINCIKTFNGEYYYENGKLHRVDGPAVEFVNGDKWWYKNGFYHREDGPAIEYVNGYKLYARIIGNYHVFFKETYFNFRHINYNNYIEVNIELPFDISESEFKKIITFI